MPWQPTQEGKLICWGQVLRMHPEPKGHLLQEKNLLEKGVTHSHMRYHGKAKRLNNLILGFPHLKDAPWNPKGISCRRNNLFWKRGSSQPCGVSLQSPEAQQSVSLGPMSYGHPLNSKDISCRRNKSFRKRDYSRLCGISLQSPEAEQSVSWGYKSYGWPLDTQGISRRRKKQYWKRGYWQSGGVCCKAQRPHNPFLEVSSLMDNPEPKEYLLQEK